MMLSDIERKILTIIRNDINSRRNTNLEFLCKATGRSEGEIKALVKKLVKSDHITIKNKRFVRVDFHPIQMLF